MLPVLAVLGGIALAIKGVEWAYRSNWLGFRDWSQRLIGGFGLVSQAVIDSFKYTAQVGGETFAAIPDDLAKKLEAAGLLDTANAWIGRAHNVMEFGGGFGKGMSAVFQSDMMKQSMGILSAAMGDGMSRLFGVKSGSIGKWFTAGMGTGEIVAGSLGVMALGIMTISATALLIAADVKGIFGWFKGGHSQSKDTMWSGTGATSIGKAPTPLMARGTLYAGSAGIHAALKAEPIMDIGYGAASGMATAAAIRDEIRAGFDRMDRAPRQQGPVQVHTTVEIDKRVLGESVEDIVIDAVRAGAGANV